MTSRADLRQQKSLTIPSNDEINDGLELRGGEEVISLSNLRS